MFILSSYTNILKTYAFGHIHDVSWGSKSGKKAPEISAARPKTPTKDEETFVEVTERSQDEIDDAFEVIVRRALEPYVREVEPIDDSRDDGVLKLRTTLVASICFPTFWCLSSS